MEKSCEVGEFFNKYHTATGPIHRDERIYSERRRPTPARMYLEFPDGG